MNAKVDTSRVMFGVNTEPNNEDTGSTVPENMLPENSDSQDKIFQLAKSYAISEILRTNPPRNAQEAQNLREFTQNATEFLSDAMQVVFDYFETSEMSQAKQKELQEDYTSFIDNLKQLAK